MTDIRFDERVAIVTGAGGGLGRSHALLLASRGAKVVVNDLGGARDGTGAGGSAMADQVVQEIKDAGGEATANYDGVDTLAGGEAIVKTALDAYGKVDILINNAGILRDRAFHNLEEADWDAVVTVHMKGGYNVTQPAIRVMRQNSYGRIIFTTSAAGLYGNFGQTNYAAAKMAVVGMMNVLKLEGAKYNIIVNTIAPIAASRLTEDVLPPAIFEKLQPELVSPMAAYLCSEECTESGGIYSVGGGYFSRAAMYEAKGTSIDGDVTPEQVRDNIATITDMTDAEEFANINGQTMGRIFPLLQKGAPTQ